MILHVLYSLNEQLISKKIFPELSKTRFEETLHKLLQSYSETFAIPRRVSYNMFHVQACVAGRNVRPEGREY